MRVAIVDADPLTYLIAITAQEVVEWEPEVYTARCNGKVARVRLRNWADQICRDLRADRAEFVFTDRSRNFRNDYWPDYKGNRNPAAKPIFLKQIADIAMDEFNGWMWEGLEGDDVAGILATSDAYWPGAEKIVVSIDKDMHTIPGKHYNPNKREKGIIEITEAEATRFHLLQSLMGDTVDGYPGCPGYGIKTAGKVIDKAIEAGEDPWKAIVACYEKKGFDEAYALNQARCAFILKASHFDTDKMVHRHWTPEGPGELAIPPTKDFDDEYSF